MRDVGEPLIPDFLANVRPGQPLASEDLGVHAHDQDLFVVRPVEDADAPALGQAPDVAPHEVVVQVFPRGLLERELLASLRIYARHDVLNGAVLTRRIHRLKHKQQGPAVLRVEHVLLFSEPLDAATEKFGRLALTKLQAAGVCRIDALQAEALALGNAEWVDVLLDAIEDLLSRHGTVSHFVKAQSNSNVAHRWIWAMILNEEMATGSCCASLKIH